MPWAAQTPHSHSVTPANYPNSGLVDNYCRNPDGEPSIWCYTMDPNLRWELCAPLGTGKFIKFDYFQIKESIEIFSLYRYIKTSRLTNLKNFV